MNIKIETQSLRDRLLNYSEKYKEQINIDKKHELILTIKNVLQPLSKQDQQSLKQNILLDSQKELLDYVSIILSKIKKGNQITPQLKSEQKKQKITNQQKNTKPNKNNSSGGIIQGVFGRFIKKQPDAPQMILPDKQPKVIYDPVKRVYIIQGEEQQVKKQIPKPPVTKKGSTLSISSNQTKPKSQIDEMTAPLAFKRKGPKSKSKIQIQDSEQNITQQSLTNKIETQFSTFLQKLSQFTQTKRNIQLENRLKITLNQYTQLWQSMNTFSQDIYRSIEQDIVSQIRGNQNSITSILKEIQNKSIIYEEIIQKLGSIRANKHQPQQLQQFKRQNQNMLKKFSQDKERQIESIKQQNYYIISDRNSNIQRLQKILSQRQNYITQLNHNNTHLLRQFQYLSENYKILQSEIQKYKNNIDQLQAQLNLNIGKNQKKQKEIQKMKASNQKLIEVINIQCQLIQYFKRNKDLSQDFNETIKSQTQLLIKIKQKRHTIQQTIATIQHSQNKMISTSTSNSILQLSDIANTVIYSHVSKIKLFENVYETLQDKYNSMKQNYYKNKAQLGNQQTSLNRSLTKLKSLADTYKLGQEEAESKANVVQLECQKLRKQISHFREQEHFTKQMLQKATKNTKKYEIEIEKISNENQSLKQNIIQLQNEIQQKDILLQAQQQQIESIKNQNKKLLTINKQNQKHYLELENIRVQLRQYSNKYQKEKQNYQILQLEKQQIESKLNQQKKQLSEKYLRQINIEKDRIHKHQKQNNQLIKRYQHLDNIYKELESKNIQIFTSLQRQRKINNEIQNNINDLEKKSKQIQQQWYKQQNDTNYKIQYFMDALKQSTEKQACLVQNLSQNRLYIQQISSKLEANQSKKIKQLQGLLLELEDSNNQLNTNLNEIQKDLLKKNQQILEYQNIIKIKQIQKKQLQAKINKLILDNQQSTNLIEIMDAGIKEKQQQYKNLFNNYQSINKKLLTENTQKDNLVIQLSQELSSKQEKYANAQRIQNQYNSRILEQQQKYKSLQIAISNKSQELLQSKLLITNIQQQSRLIINNLQQQLQIAKQKNKQIQIKLNKYQNQNNQLLIQKQALQQTLEGINQQINRKNIQIQQIKLNKQQIVNQELINQLKQKSQKILKLQQNIIILEQDKTNLSTNLNQYSLKIQQLNNENQQIKEIIFSQEKQIEQYKDDKLLTQNTIIKLQQQIQKYNDQILALTTSKISQSQKIKSQTCQQLTKQILNNKNQYQLKLKEIQKSNINIIKQKEQFYQNKISEINQKNKQLENNYLNAQKKLQQLEKQIVGVNSLKKQIKKLNDSLKDLQQENSQLWKEKTELLRINQKIMNQIDNKKQSKKDIQPVIEDKTPKLVKQDPKKAQKAGSGGFFGSLSSLFLTDRQLQKLNR